MKYGIAISTYSNQHTTSERIEIVEHCIKSLLDNRPDDSYICIVDDGSTNKEHFQMLNSFKNDIKIIHRSENGGVAKCKNSCIRNLMENGCGFSFLLDDDMLILNKDFTKVWHNASIKTGISHFNYTVRVMHDYLYEDESFTNIKKKFIININGIELLQSSKLNGCFLTITPDIIRKVGYFKVFKYKYGHAHTNFTLRCIQAGFTGKYKFVDLLNSENYIKFNVKAGRYFANPTVDRKAEAGENCKRLSESLNEYVNCEV